MFIIVTMPLPGKPDFLQGRSFLREPGKLSFRPGLPRTAKLYYCIVVLVYY